MKQRPWNTSTPWADEHLSQALLGEMDAYQSGPLEDRTEVRAAEESFLFLLENNASEDLGKFSPWLTS